MPQSWLSLGGKRFSDMIKSIVDSCARNVASENLGDEDTQCQHLFTASFVSLRNQESVLTRYLLEDSLVPHLVVEFRYYRSKRRRNSRDRRIQFVEAETGADFACSLMINLPNIANTQRHVLAQAKLVKSARIRLDAQQLTTLEEATGGELGLYAFWGEGILPPVVTIANLKAVLKASKGVVTINALQRFARPLSDSIVDDFLGLWHGADFHSRDYEETPPPQSPPVLYHLLHGGEPPPNTVYFGISDANILGVRPGFHVTGVSVPDGTPLSG